MDPVSQVQDYLTDKREIDNRLHSNWEEIFKKYDRPYADDAVVDLSNLKVVHNKGFFEKLRPKHIGHTIFASNKKARRRKRSGQKVACDLYGSSNVDSAFGSMGSFSSSHHSMVQHYPELNALDFTHADPDETGIGCMRYKFDSDTDRQPIISGPQDVIGKAYDSDSETSSVASGPVDGSNSSTSTDHIRDRTLTDFDVLDEVDEDIETTGQTSDIPSILKAKENFVNRVHRLIMQPVEGGIAWESDGYLAGNDTGSTVSSDFGESQDSRKSTADVLLLSPTMVKTYQGVKSDENRRTISTRYEEPTVTRSSSNDFNDYSTILAGNMDQSVVNTATCDADVSHVNIGLRVESKAIRNPNRACHLNRTIGGGLELPQNGAVKEIVIGSIPEHTTGQRSEESVSTQECVRNNVQRNDIPRAFATPKSKLRSKPKKPRTPKTPRTPSSLCNSEDTMLEIFLSPLPFTPTHTPGRQCQSKPSKFDFHLDTSPKGDFNTRASDNKSHMVGPSPLAKALKKMQRDAQESEQVKLSDTYIVSPMKDRTMTKCRTSNPKNSKFCAPNSVHSDNVGKLDEASNQLSIVPPLPPSDVAVDQHDTYDFHSGTSVCNTIRSQPFHIVPTGGRINKVTPDVQSGQQMQASSHQTYTHILEDCAQNTPASHQSYRHTLENTSDEIFGSNQKESVRFVNKREDNNKIHTNNDLCSNRNNTGSVSKNPQMKHLIPGAYKTELSKRSYHNNTTVTATTPKTNRGRNKVMSPLCSTTTTTPTTKTVGKGMSPSCISSPLNHLSLQSPHGASQHGFDKTPPSVKTKTTAKTLFTQNGAISSQKRKVGERRLRNLINKNKCNSEETLDSNSRFSVDNSENAVKTLTNDSSSSDFHSEDRVRMLGFNSSSSDDSIEDSEKTLSSNSSSSDDSSQNQWNFSQERNDKVAQVSKVDRELEHKNSKSERKNAKNSPEHTSKLRGKYKSPNNPAMLSKMRGRDGKFVECNTGRKLPSPTKYSPRHSKTHGTPNLVTSTPIKRGDHQASPTSNLSSPSSSRSKHLLRKSSSTNKSTLRSPGGTPESRHSSAKTKTTVTGHKNSPDASRLQKKCARRLLSRKHTDVTITSDLYDSVSSEGDTGDTSMTMSTSTVLCEGPGKCKKMFCFTCAVHELQ